MYLIVLGTYPLSHCNISTGMDRFALFVCYVVPGTCPLFLLMFVFEAQLSFLFFPGTSIFFADNSVAALADLFCLVFSFKFFFQIPQAFFAVDVSAGKVS